MMLTKQQKENIENGILQELASFIKKKGLVVNESKNVSNEAMIKRADNALEFLKSTSMRLDATSQEELDLMVEYYQNQIKLMAELLVRKYD